MRQRSISVSAPRHVVGRADRPTPLITRGVRRMSRVLRRSYAMRSSVYMNSIIDGISLSSAISAHVIGLRRDAEHVARSR